ncbi:hypothetical protein LSAT2_007913 [Lamellibrachia satsuma]|nr:hypothetical protein LSAT2_007913 [Lamellibrachia satsuma]
MPFRTGFSPLVEHTGSGDESVPMLTINHSDREDSLSTTNPNCQGDTVERPPSPRPLVDLSPTLVDPPPHVTGSSCPGTGSPVRASDGQTTNTTVSNVAPPTGNAANTTTSFNTDFSPKSATVQEDNNSNSPKTDGGACAARSPTQGPGTTPTSTKSHKLGDPPQHYSPTGNSTLVTVNM